MLDFDDEPICLEAEDGSELEFDVLCVVEREEKKYCVLMPRDEAEKELLVLEVDEDDEDSFYGVEDEEIVDDVINTYRELCGCGEEEK